ncbi:glycosyltransferase [Actinomadura welshii]
MTDATDDFELVLFGDSAELHDWVDQGATVCDYPRTRFSERDVFGLPKLIHAAGIDSFLALQYYVSPLIPCRHVRYLHDVYPLLDGVPLATMDEWRQRYDGEDLDDLVGFIRSSRLVGRTTGIEVKDVYRALYSAGIQTADVVLAISQTSACALQKIFPEHAGKISVAYPFVDPSFRATKVWRGVSKGMWKILNVGNFEPRRNQLELLRAVAMLHRAQAPVKLTMVGRPTGNYGDYVSELRRLIDQGVSEGWLEYHVWVDDGQLVEMYCDTEVLMVSSWLEGFGLPALEAMTLGVPIVAVRTETMLEVCGDAAKWCGASATSMADALERAFLTPSVLDTLSRAGVKRSELFQEHITLDRILSSLAVR